MNYNHILSVSDDAMTHRIKFADQVYIGFFIARALEPGVPKDDDFLTFVGFILY